MSEEEVTYSAGDQLTFHGLVNDLNKLRSEQEQVQTALDHARTAYPGLARDPRFQQIDEHTIKALARYDEIIREYQGKNEKAEKAEKIAKYNRDLDERNRIMRTDRDKPWLPLYDGE